MSNSSNDVSSHDESDFPPQTNSASREELQDLILAEENETQEPPETIVVPKETSIVPRETNIATRETSIIPRETNSVSLGELKTLIPGEESDFASQINDISPEINPDSLRESGEQPLEETDQESNILSGANSDAFGELRNLLLGEEIDHRIKAYQVKPKDIAKVLPEALTRTYDQSQPLIVEAVRPTIEDAIKESINQDQEVLADTLFPIIGPATRKAVTTAIKTLTDSLNQGLEMSLSPQSVGWRIEAWRTGRSFAEVVLLRTLLFQVEQVLLIHKETGLMLKDLVAETVSVQDPELVSAMLTAIEDFVKDSFKTKSDSFLDTIEFGDLNLWIEDGPQAVLACVIRGNAPKPLRTQMQESLETIHRQYDPQLESFSGDRTPFENTQNILQTCLVSKSKPKPKKKRSPLFWIVGALLIGILIVVARSVYLQHQWKSALNALDSKPGITILKAHHGWTRSHIEGFRDPLAIDPTDIIQEHGINTDTVTLKFEPYWSLSPQLIEQNARRILAPPDEVEVKYDPKTLTLSLSGIASQKWIEQSKRISQHHPRIDKVETAQLEIPEAEKLLNLKKSIESTTFEFQEGSSKFNTSDTKKFDKFVQNILSITQLSSQINHPIKIQILGQASPTGQFEDNARLSQSRADIIMRRLVEKGVPTNIIKAQGIGVKSNSVNTTIVQKAQVAFKVNLKQP